MIEYTEREFYIQGRTYQNGKITSGVWIDVDEYEAEIFKDIRRTVSRENQLLVVTWEYLRNRYDGEQEYLDLINKIESKSGYPVFQDNAFYSEIYLSLGER